MARHGWMYRHVRMNISQTEVQYNAGERKGRGWYRRDEIEGGEEQFKLL